MKLAIAKISLWSDIAHRNEVRRHYRKRVDCFPDASCPRDGDKIDGKSSTEIVFFVNEDGSTGGRIQRNNGRYDEGYNVSVKSARLLASYLGYVQSRGERDYAAACTSFCPGDVYRWDGSKIVLSPSNCLHCMTCTVKCPTLNIGWVAPEGGEGPHYKQL